MGNCLEDLIRKAAVGDVEARHELYGIFAQRIYNFILSMVKRREDAEDITQDTFVLAFRALHTLKEAARFEQWLYRIARNEAYQRFRKRRTEEAVFPGSSTPEGDDADPTENSRNPEERVLGDELATVVQQALDTLPPKLREVFILSVIHEKSYKEIAQIVGRSLLAVKTDIYRARVFAKDSIRHYLKQG